ncbi:MAG: transposase [Cyanobacteria bacterium J06638_20]
MAPQKLSEADKQDILALYRATAETSTSLANRFGVSTSTIGRILRQGLPAAEYDELVQQKRAASKASGSGSKAESLSNDASTESSTNGARTPKRKLSMKAKTDRAIDDESVAKTAVDELDDIAASLVESDRPSAQPAVAEPETTEEVDTEERQGRRSRRRKSANAEEEAGVSPVLAELEELEKEIQQDLRYSAVESEEEEDLDDDLDDEDNDDDLDDDLSDEDFDGELDDEEDVSGGAEDFVPVHLRGDQLIQILPLTDAKLPRTCYLVVDRTAELITRPLSDFAELGQIPEMEAKARILPVFDNHRIAKRFMRRAQRIVKIPDSQMFFKTRSYLQAKGITRLLVDGQIYTLEGVDSE